MPFSIPELNLVSILLWNATTSRVVNSGVVWLCFQTSLCLCSHLWHGNKARNLWWQLSLVRGTICLAQSDLIRATLRCVSLLIQLSWKSANPPFHHCCWDVLMDFPLTYKYMWCARTIRRAGRVVVGSYKKIISDVNTNKQTKGMLELMILILLTFKGPSVVRNWDICVPSKPTQRHHNVLECGGGMGGA